MVAPGFNLPAGVPGWNRLRQFKSVSQTLAANNVPMIGSTSGCDGASVQIGETNGSQGEVVINKPSASGSVALNFPSTPPTLFIAGSPDVFGTITQSTTNDVITISWSGGNGNANGRARISYQWATSD